jgi:hypothetical protein
MVGKYVANTKPILRRKGILRRKVDRSFEEEGSQETGGIVEEMEMRCKFLIILFLN